MKLKWFYLVRGQKQGPVDPDHIMSLEAAGVIDGNTPIRSERSSEWIELRDSELATRSTQCQTINRIGRLDRIYRDFRFVLGMSFLVNCVLSIMIITLLSDVQKLRQLEQLFRLAMESRLGLVLSVLCIVFYAATLVFWGLMFYRMSQVIPAEKRRLSPAVAAILSSAPGISVIAGFWTVTGLNRALTKQQRSEAVVAKRPSMGLVWVYLILGVLSLSPLMPMVLIIFLYVVWSALARQLKDAAATILHQRLME